MSVLIFMQILQAIVFTLEDYKDLQVPLPAIIQVSKNSKRIDFNSVFLAS